MNDVNGINDQQALELVREALESARDPKLRLDRLSMDATLASIGVDSMGAIEMAAYIEDKLGIRLPDDQLAQVSSVRDIAALLRRHAVRAA